MPGNTSKQGLFYKKRPSVMNRGHSILSVPFECFPIAADRLFVADFVVSDCGNKIVAMYTLLGARLFEVATCGHEMG